MAVPSIFKNGAVMTVSGTPGTGTITLGAAVPPYLSLTDAGFTTGQKVTYSLIDGTSGFEIGQGTYTTSGTTLSRDTVYRSSGAGNTAKINASSATVVEITLAAEDVIYSGLISSLAYTSSQTITIPDFATRCKIRMLGPGGGSGGANGTTSASGGAGPGAYLEKYLTGLTPGNTLAYTQGAKGTGGSGFTSGTDGGNSTLASGTQTITTLTAGGGIKSTGANGTLTAGGASGTATNGDLNMPGKPGTTGTLGSNTTFTAVTGIGGSGGVNMSSFGGDGVVAGSGKGGSDGWLVIDWYY